MFSHPPLTIFLWSLAVVIAYYFLSGFIWGAGYAPTSGKEIENVAELLEIKNGDTFYDLGCGYGRMIFTIAKRHNANCVGVEIDPLKCWWIKLMIRQKKLEGRVRVVHGNFLDVDLKDVEKAFVFLSTATPIMKKLREKMFQEMKAGAVVVSYTHRFKDWLPQKTQGKLFLYRVPELDQKIQG